MEQPRILIERDYETAATPLTRTVSPADGIWCEMPSAQPPQGSQTSHSISNHSARTSPRKIVQNAVRTIRADSLKGLRLNHPYNLSMFLAFLLLAGLGDWVPARWASNDVKSLDLVAETPINCILIDRPLWSQSFAQEAAKRGIATLAVVHPGSDSIADARLVKSFGFSGVVMQGAFEEAAAERIRKVLADSAIPLVELTTRGRMRFDSSAPIVGTFQGVWPGVQAQDDHGSAKSGPSGAPWINTNTGFLRFARASTKSAIWIANPPPEKTAVSLAQYLHAIGDAGMTGTRWVVSLDEDFNRRVLAREAGALQNWRQIGSHLKYYEDHKDWRSMRAHSQLALVEDVDTGALLSGGVLDMIAVKHTPVRPIPYGKITAAAMEGAKMAVDVNPAALSPGQRDVLKAFTRSGGTMLTGPPGWKFDTLRKDDITLGKDDLSRLDEIWKELNSLTGRTNLGARLFNVSSMLSNLLEAPDQKQLVLQLVNYTDFPVENITAHVLGSFHKARLFRPNEAPRTLETYAVEDGTGIDIDKIGALATLILE